MNTVKEIVLDKHNGFSIVLFEIKREFCLFIADKRIHKQLKVFMLKNSMAIKSKCGSIVTYRVV